MVLLPTDPTILSVNAEKLLLKTGANPDTYTALQDLRFNLERPEYKEPVTGISNTPTQTAVYFYGPADNWVEFTLMMSETEYATFAVTNFTRDANGAMPIVQYKIVATDESGNIKTIGNTGNSQGGFKAVTVKSTIDKPVAGGVKVRIRLRLLEDVITVS